MARNRAFRRHQQDRITRRNERTKDVRIRNSWKRDDAIPEKGERAFGAPVPPRHKAIEAELEAF